MTPDGLLDLCLERIREWRAEPLLQQRPSIALTIRRGTPPRGRTTPLYGRSGPKGRIAVVKEAGREWDVTAYFDAGAIAADLSRELGIAIDADAGRRADALSAPDRPGRPPDADAPRATAR